MRENLTSQQLRELHVLFLGPFWHFGPIWDQVPNLRPFWSACISTYSLFVKNSKKIEFLGPLSHRLGPIFAQNWIPYLRFLGPL